MGPKITKSSLAGGAMCLIVMGVPTCYSGTAGLLPSPQAQIMLASAREEQPVSFSLSYRGGAMLPDPYDGEDGSSGGGRRVSRRRAFFLSLLLPGLGQRANGDYGRAKIFMGLEAGIWTTAAGFRVVGKMREDDYREFARYRASADPSEDSEDYYQLVSDYRSSDDYNIDVRRDARAIYPRDRELQLKYIEENSITGMHGWEWPDDDTQWDFRYLRHDALSAKRTSVLLTGWAVLNRVISAIEAARSAGGSSPEATNTEPTHMEVGLIPHGQTLALGLRWGRSF